MKKLVIMTIMTLFASLAFAKDVEQAIDYTQLPNRAQEFIQIYFNEFPVKKAVKVSSENAYVEEYKVVLTNKVAIEFDMVGMWSEIKLNKRKNIMPRFIYPDKVSEALDKKFADKKIKQVENDGLYYDFDFSDGSQAKINALGQILEFGK